MGERRQKEEGRGQKGEDVKSIFHLERELADLLLELTEL
jgi:hypothetical protein